MQVCKSSYGLHMVWKFTCYLWKSNYSLLVFPVKRLYLRLCKYCSHRFNIIQRMLSHVKLTSNWKPSVVCSYMRVRQVQIIWFTSHVWCEMMLMTFSTIRTNCHQFRNCLKLPPMPRSPCPLYRLQYIVPENNVLPTGNYTQHSIAHVLDSDLLV